MCKKQTSVSQSSTESEIISFDAGLRMDGVPALDLRELIIEVWHSSSNQPKKSSVTHHQENTPTTKLRRQFSTTILNYATSIMSSFGEDDGAAVIKMIIKGRSPTMRHVSRTHRVALDWLFDRINLNPKSKSNILTPKTNSLTY